MPLTLTRMSPWESLCELSWLTSSSSSLTRKCYRELVGEDVPRAIMDCAFIAPTPVAGATQNVSFVKTRRRNTCFARIGARALGVDYGLRRVGLAVSVGVAPRALPRIDHKRNPAQAAAAVARSAVGTVSETIVVGMPVDAHGSEGEQVKATRVFLDELVAAAPWATIVSLDERYTTMEARETLEEAGVAREEVPFLVDSASAVVLLNRYFGEGDDAVAVTVHVPTERESEGEENAGDEFISFAEWKREAMARARANTVTKPGSTR